MSGVNQGAVAAPHPAPAEDAAVLIYATFPAPELAETIVGHLVEARLAACANIFPGMRAIYRWQGVLERESEAAAVIKTAARLAPRVVGYVRIVHPYVNPALVVVPVVGGSADFLAWIAAETRDAG